MKNVLKTMVATAIMASAFIGLGICPLANVNAQGVGINPSGNNPDPSAGLDVNFTNKGLLIPRVALTSLTDVTTIPSPAQFTMVFNTNTNCLEYFIGTSWQNITCPCTGSLTTPGPITGNATPCANSAGNIYSIAAVANATYYTWTVPAGATITAGQGTTSITVTFGTISGNVTVAESNNCGTSTARTLQVTIPPVPHGNISFTYTGSLQNWTVPCGIVQVTAYMWGAGGSGCSNAASAGGSGAFVGAVLNVAGVSTLNIIVGQGPLAGTSYMSSSTYGGGGGSQANIGSGGGRSAIQFNDIPQDVLTAGGGGGGAYIGGSSYYGNGGGGGNGTTASNGTNGNSSCTTDNGNGGTATGGGAGGVHCGASGADGASASSTLYNYQGALGNSYGGAGGGGYYGGGAGANTLTSYGGGGGGGSSFPTTINATVTSFIFPTTAPIAGNTNPNGTNNTSIFPAQYNVSPFNSYYVTGVGTSGISARGGNGLVIIIF